MPPFSSPPHIMVQLLAPDLNNVIARVLQQLLVVGDNHKGALGLLEEVAEPLDGGLVQVVGGLVLGCVGERGREVSTTGERECMCEKDCVKKGMRECMCEKGERERVCALQRSLSPTAGDLVSRLR
jgi:hypothetical protein